MPLLLLALGAGIMVYALSPSAHAWTDAHVAAMRDAFASHQAADAKLDAARAALDVHAATQAAPPAPPVSPATPAPSAPAPSFDPGAILMHAWESLKASAQANAAAASHTTTALETAKTDQQKKVAAQSAATVDARQQQIVAAFEHFGPGQCDVHSYAHVTAQIKDALLARLHSHGMTVTGGDNLWDIDTHVSKFGVDLGVKLRAVWDPNAQVLKLIVTSGKGGLAGLVTCEKIWAEIEPVMKEILGS